MKGWKNRKAKTIYLSVYKNARGCVGGRGWGVGEYNEISLYNDVFQFSVDHLNWAPYVTGEKNSKHYFIGWEPN